MGKILRYVERELLHAIGAVFFCVSAIWMLVEALSRQLFERSFAISEEVIVFSMVWAVFLSLAQAGRKNYHISVNLFISKLSAKPRRIVNILTSCLSVFYCALIFISSIKFIPHLYRRGVISESPLQIPMWIVYMCIPVGAILLCLFYFLKAFSYMRKTD